MVMAFPDVLIVRIWWNLRGGRLEMIFLNKIYFEKGVSNG